MSPFKTYDRRPLGQVEYSGSLAYQWPPLFYLPSMPTTDIIIRCRPCLSIIVIKKLLQFKATAVRSYLTKLSICPPKSSTTITVKRYISYLWKNLKTCTVKSFLSCDFLCVTYKYFLIEISLKWFSNIAFRFRYLRFL